MQRDFDLIKSILLKIENETEIKNPEFKLDGYTFDQVNYHLKLLHDAGYIECTISGYGRVFPKRLT